MNTDPAAGCPMAGRSAVVLGGTGFLGGHVAAAFATAGASVLQVSRNAPAGAAAKGCRSVRLDLVRATEHELADLLAGADVVVNAIGMVWTTAKREVFEADMFKINAEFPGRVAAAVAGLPRRPRLIHLGSAHEYGPSAAGISIAEDWVPAPDSTYGTTKLLGTCGFLDAARAGRVTAVVLRPANVCGPGTPPRSLLGTVAAHLAGPAGTDGRPVRIRLAPLRAVRDFVDARDVADAVTAAAAAPRAQVAGLVINVGHGAAVPVRWLVERMIALSGRAAVVVEEPGTGSAAARSGAQWQQLDISRAKTRLGWRPRRSLDESLADQLRRPSTREKTWR